MGEYIIHNENTVQIGFYEDPYFASYQALKREKANISRAPGCPSLDHYLDEKNGYRYRFPFPWEDDVEIGAHMYSDYGYAIEVHRFWPTKDIHKDIPVQLSCDGRWTARTTYPVRRPSVPCGHRISRNGGAWCPLK